MQTLQVSHSHFSGSSYTMVEIPYVTVSPYIQISPNKKNRVAVRNRDYNLHPRIFAQTEKSTETKPVVISDIAKENTENNKIFVSKMERKAHKKALSIERKQLQQTKQFMQNYQEPDSAPILEIEITPNICEIVTDFVDHKVKIPFLVCAPLTHETR